MSLSFPFDEHSQERGKSGVLGLSVSRLPSGIEGDSAPLFHVTDNPLVANDMLASGGTMEIQCL